MKTLDEVRAILGEHRQVLREHYGVQELALFGSFARGEPSPVSDVDILGGCAASDGAQVL